MCFLTLCQPLSQIVRPTNQLAVNEYLRIRRVRRYRPQRPVRVIAVEDRPAYAMTNRLTLEEGLFVGMSSGAAVCAAVEAAGEMSKSETVVVLLPDRGDRYLSTNLFRSVCAECPP